MDTSILSLRSSGGSAIALRAFNCAPRLTVFIRFRPSSGASVKANTRTLPAEEEEGADRVGYSLPANNPRQHLRRDFSTPNP